MVAMYNAQATKAFENIAIEIEYLQSDWYLV